MKKESACGALVALCMAQISGCAFVESKTASEGTYSEGVSYYLPLRPVKLTYIRSVKMLSPEKEFDAAKKKYLAAKVIEEAAKATVQAAAAVLKSNIDSNASATLALKFGEADAAMRDAQNKLAAADKALAETFEEVKKDQSISPYCRVEEVFSAEPMPMVADFSKRMVANLKHSPFRSDNLTIATSSAGLLDNTTGTAADQTAAILVALAQSNAALQFSGDSNNVKFNALSTLIEKPIRKLNPCSIAPIRTEQVLDPTSDDLEKFAALLPNLSVTLDPMSDIECPPKSTTELPATINGLAYRRDRPYVLTVKRDSALLASIRLDLPQGAPIDILPLKSGFGNTVTLGADFDNGMLISHTNTRPSEALAIASIPFNVASAALQVPATLLQFKVTQVNEENKLAAALLAQGATGETNQVNAQRALLCAQEKLQAAQENRAVNPNICAP